MRRDDLNSMLYWYPKILGLVPTPKTRIVKVGFDSALKYLDGNQFPRSVRSEIEQAISDVRFPLFLRSDLASGKHRWKETCFVDNANDLPAHIAAVIEENLCADVLGLPMQALVFREFLNLDSAFKAFLGMPIAREFRLFASDGEVLCLHPYWPPNAIRFWGDTEEPPDWRERLAEISKPLRESEMRAIASVATKILGGYWSVDVCFTKGGELYMTDIAQGQDSDHWRGCPNEAKEE